MSVNAERRGLLQSEGTTTLLSDYQSLMLRESRAALFSAISSGSRSHNSKSHNSFTWRAALDGGRATCDGPSAYGVHFLTLGRYSAVRKQLELLPEEALYLAERGVIELWKEATTPAGTLLRVPMSVQQCWVEIVGCDDLTLERYQVSFFTFPLISNGPSSSPRTHCRADNARNINCHRSMHI